jgi:hypothetical protein
MERTVFYFLESFEAFGSLKQARNTFFQVIRNIMHVIYPVHKVSSINVTHLVFCVVASERTGEAEAPINISAHCLITGNMGVWSSRICR